MAHARRNLLILGLMLTMIVTMTIMLSDDHRSSRVSGSLRLDGAAISAVAQGAGRSPLHRMRAEDIFADLTNAADIAYAAGNLTEARELYGKALRLAPANPDLLKQYANVHYLQHRFDEAIIALGLRRQAAPGRVEAHTDLAVALLRVGRLGDAGQILHEALGMVSDDQAGPIYFLGACVEEQAGQLETRDQLMAAAAARLAPEEMRLALRLWLAQNKEEAKAAIDDRPIPLPSRLPPPASDSASRP